MDESTPPTLKRCRLCGESKPLTSFHKRAGAPDGRRGECSGCKKVSRAEARRTEDPEKVRERRQRVRPCDGCGQPITHGQRNCRSCRTTERECVTCRQSFRGNTSECRRCQAVDRRCTDCNREFRSSGGNKRCGACQATERECESCGRTFKGFTRHCRGCQGKDRECAGCGRSFKGTARYCTRCQAKERECTNCGHVYTGTKSKCNACMSTKRTCLGCGQTFTGHQNFCWRCQTIERECLGCGRTFRSHALRCYPCTWMSFSKEERVAKALRWRGIRRARKAKAQILGPVSEETYAAIMASAPCSYCGDVATTVDHIRPLSQGGIEHESNLTPCCGSCNSSKNAKLLIEWDADRVARAVSKCPKVAAEYARQLKGLALF